MKDKRNHNSEDEAKTAIKKNAVTAKDWEYHKEAGYLYSKAILFKKTFFGRSIPDPVISFDNLRNHNTLAAYSLVRNPQGLLDEITFNTQHYIESKSDEGLLTRVWQFGRWAQLETELHELTHLWQQNSGKDPVKVGRIYHNAEFVDKCESLGLHPKPVSGNHIKLADGRFAELMHYLGVTPPKDSKDLPPELGINWWKELSKRWGQERKGTSSLAKWTCSICSFAVRVGIKGDPQLIHEPDQGRFIKG